MQNVELKPLVEVVARLMAPDGCPWDRVQTHESMRPYMIEEAYEVCEAIDRKDAENLREELGDVLYQVIFHALLAEKEGRFDLQEVVDAVTAKMKRRHPALYPEAAIAGARDWESIKRAEKDTAQQTDGLPQAFPATLKLSKLVGKLRRRGVDVQTLENLCADDEMRALLSVVLRYQAAEKDLEWSAQSLAKVLEAALEKLES